MNFSYLKKNLKKDFSNCKKIKIAFLADSSSQFICQAIRGMAFEFGIDLNIFESDFNQIGNQIYDKNSELYEFNPEIVIIFQSAHKLLLKYNKSNNEEMYSLASNELNGIQNYFNTLLQQLNAKVIYYNYTEIDDAVFGNFANNTESSFLFQIRKLNYELMQMSVRNPNFYLCDISSIQNQIGKSNIFQTSVYINTEMVFSIDALPMVASKTVDLIKALKGNFKKCVILDLDNTTWGGVIGDDGLENIHIGSLGIGKAFSEFQYWIKKLKNRGIIITVCSKNTEAIAKEPFEKHPDMILRLEDIAVFRANWNNKVDNIRYIQRVLNIGYDSMVFLDDNPFERNIVREGILDITVPELPSDPADYLEYLYSLNLFETVSFSSEDAKRTKLYQIEAERTSTQLNFTDENNFLQSLNMQSVIAPFNKFNTPRVAQLSQRSNQFNLRTVRYTDNDIVLMISSNNIFTFTFTLEDKFGDNGLVCVVVLKLKTENILFIESWFMSCRVLKRGMENFVLNKLIDFAKQKNIKMLESEYIPSSKNEIVDKHYFKLGFQEKSKNYWELNVKNYQTKECFIKLKK